MINNTCPKKVYRIDSVIRINPEEFFYVGTDASFVITFNDTDIARRGDFYNKASDDKDSLFMFDFIEVQTGKSTKLAGHSTRMASPRL